METREGSGAVMLPMLVMDWSKILSLASKGYVDLLKMAVEHYLEEGTAKLLYNSRPSGASGESPPPVTLSAPVVQATWGGHATLVRYFCDNFSDIVVEEDEISQAPDWSTLHCCSRDLKHEASHRHGPYMASHIAASLGNVEILRLWGESCVGWRDDLGRTPIHWAAYCGQKMAVEYLLGVGASASVTNNVGLTPVSECIDSLGKITTGHSARFEILILFLESGATLDDARSAAFLEVVMESFGCLTDDEINSLVLCLTRVNKKAMISIGNIFCIMAPSIATKQSSFSYLLRFLSYFCKDLSQVSTLWDRAFQLDLEQEAKIVYLPAIHYYGDRNEITSWVEAESMLTQAKVSSDPTEVMYQCAIMLERALGSDNPWTVEMLWNAPTLLGLEQVQPSQALGDMFLRAIELFESIVNSPTHNKHSFYLLSPINYFDKLVEINLAPDFAQVLKAVLSALDLVYSWEGEAQVQQCSNFLAAIGFDLLCGWAYLALRDQESKLLSELPPDIDELALQLMDMCPPLLSYHRFRIRTPSWLRDEEEKIAYTEWVTKCYESWMVSSGSLYTLDKDGDMLVTYLFKGLKLYKYNLNQQLLDFILEHGSHPDAVDSSNKTPYDILKTCELQNHKTDAVIKSSTVFPLTCLAARIIVTHRLQYGGHLPPNLFGFISMHDSKRTPNLLFSHKTDYHFKHASNSTEIVAEFDIPF